MPVLNELYRQERGQQERGFSRATIGEKLQVYPRTINDCMKKIPQDIDISKQSLALERFMKVNNGFEMENIGGLAYTTEERSLILFRILCGDAKLVDMEKEYQAGKSSINDWIDVVKKKLFAVDSVKYSEIMKPLTGTKFLQQLTKFPAYRDEVIRVIRLLDFPYKGPCASFTTGEKAAIIDYVVRRGKLSCGKMSSSQMDQFYMKVAHAKGNGLKALGAKHNNQVLIDQGERLLAASTKHQTVTDWSREGARAMEEELTKRKTHNTAHGRILKCDPNFTDEFTKLVEY